jgi:predicted nucleic-acid-binding Zn-ribbon protein
MLKHKCPKCDNELGYKWNTRLHDKDNKCPKCKAKLEVTGYVTLGMFLSLAIGIIITNYIAPMMGVFNKYPQVTKGVVTFLSIILIWLVVSTIMPRQLRIKVKKK